LFVDGAEPIFGSPAPIHERRFLSVPHEKAPTCLPSAVKRKSFYQTFQLMHKFGNRHRIVIVRTLNFNMHRSCCIHRSEVPAMNKNVISPFYKNSPLLFAAAATSSLAILIAWAIEQFALLVFRAW
jgi:hypothetical protein